ncbi:hypothetical protein PG994_003275 [Apiospora phragmitis]|uniref:Uncharacterized protein n=1 Tax=Apiospora phragmitis TaxID=2905665 RepID=A0ABR1VXM9_9PEZI
MAADNQTSGSNGSVKSYPEAWTKISQYLLPRNPEYNFWWQLTGRHLAVLLDAAGYPIERQYEALMFHYNWAIPYMGPAPGANGVIPGKWKSLLQADGTPMEYSWKWNSSRAGDRPEIRYAMEPIGPYTGTGLDPLNQQATRELLHRLDQAIPSMNLQWSNHFFAMLFDHDVAKLAAEGRAGADLSTSTGFGIDFGAAGPAIKTYFQGRKLGQTGFMPLEDWVSAIKPLLTQDVAVAVAVAGSKNDSSCSSSNGGHGEGSLGALLHFIASHPEGAPLNPFSLAVDCVQPEKSRMKLYMNTPRTSFASVRDIMTLGGRITGEVVDSQLRALRELIRAVLGLPEDFSDEAETEQTYFKESLSAATASAPVVNGHTSTNGNGVDGKKKDSSPPTPPPHNPGFVYFFDVSDGRPLPEIKLNIPLRSYGHNDLRSARGLVDWMQARGRGAFGDRYLETLERLAPGGGASSNGSSSVLEQTRGLQSFISIVFSRSGELGINSYLAVRGSDVFEKVPVSGGVRPTVGRRGTLRRDE